jgi:hypothetical protein
MIICPTKLSEEQYTVECCSVEAQLVFAAILYGVFFQGEPVLPFYFERKEAQDACDRLNGLMQSQF